MPPSAPQVQPIDAFVLSESGTRHSMQPLMLDPPKADEVLVEVAYCGVCHTDLHVIKDEVAFPKPAVLGHEISGVVRAVGAEVTHVSPGDRVVCSFIMPCGQCRHCQNGMAEICDVFFTENRLKGRLLDGTTRIHDVEGKPIAMYSMSGHANLAVVPLRAVYPLPDTIDLKNASILGCSLFTAYGAVNQVGQVAPGDSVAVVATGGIGASIVHLAKAAGAENIFAIDIDDDKLELARSLGATHTINSRTQDPVEIVNAVLGRGADVVFEALGSTPTTVQAVNLADDGARVVLAGIAPAGHTMDVEITKVVRRKIQILGCFGANPLVAMPAVIELAAAGKIDFDTLITRTFAFDETAQAYRLLADQKINGRSIIEIGTNL